MPIPVDASQYPVKAVTVFNSQKAEVTRSLIVRLNKGHNELAITSLPSCILPESARINGLVDAVLYDVVCTVDDAQDAPRNADSDALKGLRRRRGVLEGEKALKHREMDILEQYGRTLNAEHNTTSSVEAFLEFIDGRGSNMLKEVEAIDAQIAEVDKEIETESSRLQKEHQKAVTRARVSAVIMARRTGDAEILLTYMVNNATWSPLYDLHAVTEDGEPSRIVSLHYRAAIQQTTGEDWRDAAVSVSTAAAGLLTDIPPLRAMKIAPGLSKLLSSGSRSFPTESKTDSPSRPRGPKTSFIVKGSNHSRTTSLARSASIATLPHVDTSADITESFGSSGGDEQSLIASDDKESWTETKAIVVEGAISSLFRIEGNCTIPSEPNAHKATIAVLTFNAQVNHVAVPRSSPAVFIECEVKNSSGYRLLQGPVSVFLDNSPVSKTTINDVSPHEVFKCTLGPDPWLRIKCTRLPRSVKASGASFLSQTNLVTYKIYTTVYNGHGFRIRGLQVRDAAPDASRTSENENGPAIKVAIKRPEGLGEAAHDKLMHVATPSRTSTVNVRWCRDVGMKDGRYEWVVDIGPGEELRLEAEYEIRAPSDYVWHLSEEYFN